MAEAQQPTTTSGGGEQRPETVGQLVAGLPAWKKVLLLICGAMMLIGGGMQVFALMTAEPAADPVTQADEATGEGGAGRSELGPLARGLAGGAGTGSGYPESSDNGDAADDPAATQVEGQEDPSALARGVDRYGPAVFKLGMSFFIGFAAGFALRMFFKTALLFVGFLFLGMVFFQYIGFVEINWGNVTEFDWLLDRIGDELMSFREFISGVLPSAASGSLGLASGMIKR